MHTAALTVDQWVEHFRELWLAGDPGWLPLERRYTAREQALCEAALEHLLSALQAEQKAPPRTPGQRQAARTRVRALFDRLAQAIWDRDPPDLAALPDDALVDAGLDFARAARRFDPQLSDADVEQAARNALTANGLQHLLDLPVALTPAIFGYSLLYPYSDNLLDDPTRSSAAKHAFNTRFRRRLAGEPVDPRGAHEERIFALVGLIEGQFARAAYPQVYASLLAIHRAQGQSLGLQAGAESAGAPDVLGVSFAKGGTSVLADGCLVAGSLSADQAVSVFGLGVFAQLVDDLEDVQADQRAGRLTLFSQARARGALDAVTNLTFQFGARAVTGLAALAAPDGPAAATPFTRHVAQGAALLLVVLAGGSGRGYSHNYRRALEAHSPFRFAALARQLARLARPGWSLGQLLELSTGLPASARRDDVVVTPEPLA